MVIDGRNGDHCPCAASQPAASMVLSRGVNVKLISATLGHATMALTSDTYSHAIPAMHVDAAAAMDAIFTA